jgi:hypothetical protein
LERVRRPKLWFLASESQIRSFTCGEPDSIRAMTHDQCGRRGRDRIRAAEYVLDKWLTRKLMENLGELRLHSGTLTRGENNDVDVRHR